MNISCTIAYLKYDSDVFFHEAHKISILLSVSPHVSSKSTQWIHYCGV